MDDDGLELPSVSMANEREDGEVTSMDIEPGQEMEDAVSAVVDEGDDDDKSPDVVPVGELATDVIMHGLSSVSDPQEFILKFQNENKLSSAYDKTKQPHHRQIP